MYNNWASKGCGHGIFDSLMGRRSFRIISERAEKSKSQRTMQQQQHEHPRVAEWRILIHNSATGVLEKGGGKPFYFTHFTPW